jgi:hypothetical protein
VSLQKRTQRRNNLSHSNSFTFPLLKIRQSANGLGSRIMAFGKAWPILVTLIHFYPSSQIIWIPIKRTTKNRLPRFRGRYLMPFIGPWILFQQWFEF